MCGGGGEEVKKTAKTKKRKAKVSAPVIPSSDLEDSNTQCIFCAELCSNTQDEDWIQSTACSQWAHDDCVGVDPDCSLKCHGCVC